MNTSARKAPTIRCLGHGDLRAGQALAVSKTGEFLRRVIAHELFGLTMPANERL